MIMIGNKKKETINHILGPDESEKEAAYVEKEEGSHLDSLHTSMEELIEHIHNKDTKGAAEAFRAAHMSVAANEPDHEEGTGGED